MRHFCFSCHFSTETVSNWPILLSLTNYPQFYFSLRSFLSQHAEKKRHIFNFLIFQDYMFETFCATCTVTGYPCLCFWNHSITLFTIFNLRKTITDTIPLINFFSGVHTFCLHSCGTLFFLCKFERSFECQLQKNSNIKTTK